MSTARDDSLGRLAPGRRRLATLLGEAAELEHALVCQYLYAFLSLKRSVAEGVTWEQLELMRRWGASLTLIARQEMEHLGLVCNLLTAIGEAPRLARPDFPLGPRVYELGIPLALEPFGLQALQRFVRLEMPAQPSDADVARLRTIGADVPQRNSIALLYEEISNLLTTLDGPDMFIGPPGAQLETPTIIPVPIRGVHVPNAPVYDVYLTAVTDLASAQAVVAQIVLEGEGGPGGSPTSHFARLCDIHAQLLEQLRAAPDFAPARPVVADPLAPDAVTVPSSRAVRDLLDSAYMTILLLLHRFFAHADESPAELAALQAAVFFPMMTAVLRPLGEVCTQLPAHARGTATAAPSFRCTREIALLPHRRSAWMVIAGCLADLAEDAGRLAADTASYTPAVRARLQLVHENLACITRDFDASMSVGA
jgi:hypothetical protein